MKYIHEYLHYPKHIPERHVYMFTGNRVITSRNTLVMGGGNALSCLQAYPNIDRRIAKKMQKMKKDILNLYLDKGKGLVGCMFTKNHYKDPSPLDMVIKAIEDLDKTARGVGQKFIFHLPYPAIGLGGLSREDLDKHIEKLPDNVYVYI